jgi:hypothetical protein
MALLDALVNAAVEQFGARVAAARKIVATARLVVRLFATRTTVAARAHAGGTLPFMTYQLNKKRIRTIQKTIPYLTRVVAARQRSATHFFARPGAHTTCHHATLSTAATWAIALLVADRAVALVTVVGAPMSTTLQFVVANTTARPALLAAPTRFWSSITAEATTANHLKARIK